MVIECQFLAKSVVIIVSYNMGKVVSLLPSYIEFDIFCTTELQNCVVTECKTPRIFLSLEPTFRHLSVNARVCHLYTL